MTNISKGFNVKFNLVIGSFKYGSEFGFSLPFPYGLNIDLNLIFYFKKLTNK